MKKWKNEINFRKDLNCRFISFQGLKEFLTLLLFATLNFSFKNFLSYFLLVWFSLLLACDSLDLFQFYCAKFWFFHIYILDSLFRWLISFIFLIGWLSTLMMSFFEEKIRFDFHASSSCILFFFIITVPVLSLIRYFQICFYQSVFLLVSCINFPFDELEINYTKAFSFLQLFKV